MLESDVSKITLEQFKESFYAKFFSGNVKHAKQQEFLNLEQGDMTVEYTGLESTRESWSVQGCRQRVRPWSEEEVESQPALAPQRDLRSGGVFQRHRQELAAAGRTLRELPASGRCGRVHEGHCLIGSGVCFRCKQPGHNADVCAHKLIRTTPHQPFASSREEFLSRLVRRPSELDFDVILGMDWLFANHASIDCFRKEVIFNPPSRTSFKFKGAGIVCIPKVISAMKASKLLSLGTWSILASVVDTREPEVFLSFETVEREYPDVF
ncbi:ty3-gypsy retrotransposon protein [Cucumis melo var. makuwa]|uniref:Ty3-gypsy retrotransposon protein n=1 Tax=Cucumis melo var. makuwa TaxID=1194695 RepID=A0A5A7TG91_CUCMM|nr:ty3-gypsy retrotransposon protein [Cucumis melo var. makuwa]